MSRAIVRASSGRITYTTASGAPYRGFTSGTMAVVCRRATSGTNYHIMHCGSDGAETSDSFGFQFEPGNNLQLWEYWGAPDDTGLSTSTITLTSSEGWALCVVTRAAGTTTPAFWIYKYATNTWTTGNGDKTLQPPASFGNSIWIGNGQPAESAGFDGHIAAVLSTTRVLNDAEVRRLPRGRWSELGGPADFLQEFPSGRDNGTAQCRTVGRVPMRSSATVGTTRATLADPPGFRFSTVNRRV